MRSAFVIAGAAAALAVAALNSARGRERVREAEDRETARRRAEEDLDRIPLAKLVEMIEAGATVGLAIASIRATQALWSF